MLRTSYKHLNTIQKGTFGEAYAKMAFTLEGFEVYSSEYDDRGIDFIVRNRSGRFFSVQVKATDDTSNPFVYESKFRDRDDYIFCAARIIDGEQPSLYIAQGSEWKTGIECLYYNSEGGKSGPYYEMRFASKYREQLVQFEFRTYIERIKT
ncbi:DUF4365 domain-containing protein [bacterium]|nr:DUF4365 domain-containing protein [bacterium]